MHHYACYEQVVLIHLAGKTIPRDGSLKEKRLVRVKLLIYVILCIISSLGVVLGLSFLALNIYYRNHV